MLLPGCICVHVPRAAAMHRCGADSPPGSSPGDLDADDLSDLEDFIVVNPERDYGSFIARHFPQKAAEEDEEEQERGGEAGGDGGEE